MIGISFMQAQSNCLVKLEALSISYSGQCKKGFAEGHGEAKGKDDIYIGDFRKGLPHGKGTYKWGNGNVYIGEFKKGEMHGKGVLKIIDSDGKIENQDGYFDKGEYLGEYIQPYAVISKREIKNVYIQEDPSIVSLPNNYVIHIKFKYEGKYFMPNQIQISNSKNIEERREDLIVLKNVQFPNKEIEITFRTASGHFCSVKFDIYKKGNWLVEISI